MLAIRFVWFCNLNLLTLYSFNLFLRLLLDGFSFCGGAESNILRRLRVDSIIKEISILQLDSFSLKLDNKRDIDEGLCSLLLMSLQ